MHRLYKYILFFACLCLSLQAEAKVYKDSDGYWLITSVEDYIEVANKEEFWDGKIRQVADLDFQGGIIPQIGRRGKAFSGTYDGQGCKISNGVMYWNPVLIGSAKEVAFGLFRHVQGTATKPAYLRNIVMSGITLTLQYPTAADGTTFNEDNDDVKLGMLVGSLGQYSDIQNIQISKCKISDDNVDDIRAHGIFAGGAVGDLSSSYGGYDPMKSKNFVFKGIYCDVDIDLPNILPSRIDNFQAYAGGIVGRIRFPESIGYIPSGTLYTGTINLPIGSESPTVGSMRVRDIKNDALMAAFYSGEFGPTKTENQTVYDSFKNAAGTLDAEAYNNFCKKHRFYNYSAYNSNTSKVEQITATYPSTDASLYLYGTRTFSSNKSFKVLSSTNLKNNAQIQGVNYGYLTDPSAEEAEILGMLDSEVGETYNDGTADKKKYYWRLNGDKFEFVRNYKADWYELKIKVNQATGFYDAKVYYKYTDTEFIPGPDTSFQWYSATSVKDGGNWVAINDGINSSINPDRSLYYKVKWTSADGIVYESDYFAPTRTVYVFNRTSNDEYNSAFTTAHNSGADAIPVHILDSATYPNAGKDTNSGLTPEEAVLTMERAFEILDEDGDEQSNSIVVMGYYVDDKYLITNNFTVYKTPYINDTNSRPLYSKPTTISGTDNDKISNGIFGLKGNTGDYSLYLTAPLRFDNIDIQRHWTLAENTKYGNTLFIVCNYFDFTVDQNVRFINLSPHAKNYGMPEDITSIPYFTVVAGTYNWNFDCRVYPLLYPSDLFPGRSNYYAEEGRSNVNISSGVYGRIICSGRNAGANTNSHNITGSYKVPSRVKLNINIKDDIDFDKGGHQFTSYGVDVAYDKTLNKLYYTSANFSHNIGLISGGQTDGSTYGDIEMNVFSGYIGRVITSNITYGRDANNFPSDSFFGRSILNIFGKTTFDDATGKVWSETTINEVFGGILGRTGDSDGVCQPYFYGQSEINMYGGYIGPYLGYVPEDDKRNLKELSKISPSIYGAGSGGVAGLGDEFHQTSDKKIPYLNGESVEYGPFDKDKRMPVMSMYDKKIVDLNHTECSVNLYGGIVHGNVYGAGYGNSNNISLTLYTKAPEDLGSLYGNSYVSMLKHPDYQPAIVLGNVYGGAAGSKRYAVKWEDDHKDLDEDDPNKTKYCNVAAQYGNTSVVLRAGTVGDFIRGRGGDVFGGAQGIASFENIAALYGNTNLEIDGATIYGNIFAGSELANIRKYGDASDSGNTTVTVSSGTVGNNIFGGSKGEDKLKDSSVTEDSKAIIEGDSYVNVNGGDFLGYPYIKYNQEKTVDGKSINIVTHRSLYRTFNIYGGGYLNCDIKGDSHVNVLSSLLCDINSFPDPAENANAVIDDDAEDENHPKKFHSAYMDITFRSFCVYGGGYGEKTNVLNTNVYVKIPENRANVALPHGNTLKRFLDHQSFFDIAGGGYSGDIGYWVNVKEVPVSKVPEPTLTAEELGKLSPREQQIKLDNDKATIYDHYVGGNCRVIIDGYTYARKIIGGGFYGSCKNTNTHVRCGSLRQVYGGSLLGYVHDRAFLQFGNRVEDFIHVSENPAGGFDYKYDATGVYDFNGSVNDVKGSSVWTDASYRAKELNQYIFITENIYGGNDVKGIIGTEKWTSPEGNFGIDHTDGGPLYRTDVNDSEQKGIVFNIYGGTFMGDVYSAGNGHYRGYYVPEWVRYDDGPDRMYREVRSSVDPSKTGKAYRSRPMVGSVNVNLRGNSTDDCIYMLGNFFGGGRECSIGQYNTFLPLEDPRRLVKGGHLHVNIGGHVHIDGNVYLGSEGNLYSTQHVVPADIDVAKFNGSTTSELARLGDTAYEHWYFNTEIGCYVPGFPAPGELDGNFGMAGEHMFRGYIKNIEMEGDVELTFYRYLYERNADGSYKDALDDQGNVIKTSDGETIHVRKQWVPGEMAMRDYDATDIRMKSFYLGGLCGSMTNNNVMIYDFTDKKSYEEDKASDIPATNEKESWGSVYRVTLPEGVTIRENVVMGSENATMKFHQYSPDYRSIVDGDPVYVYEGGIVTHSGYGFDLIVYNDLFHNSSVDNAPWRDLPEDFYDTTVTDYDLPGGEKIYNKDEWNHSNGKLLYRQKYVTDDYYLSDVTVAGYNITDPRFALAVYEEDGKRQAYIGRREQRRITGTATGVPVEYKNKMTVTKLTTGCQFDLMGDHSSLPSLYGGNIYGGCYNSGVVTGDVVMIVGSNLLGNAFDNADDITRKDYADLRYNIGRVFGGGYGHDTKVDGDTYIVLVNNFKGMNVFGGGMEGDVTGTANINYIGYEKQSMIYGAIYGGGLRGAIGTEDVTEQATTVRLFSGNVNSVFGGSCMGELYGRTFVELCDKVTNEISHFNYERFLRYNTEAHDWSDSRLLAGNVFGGNDIAGIIHPHKDTLTPDPSFEPSKLEDHFKYFTTGVYIHEEKEDTSSGSTITHKDTPGAVNGYNGFPLVGNLYGGSNGDYGTHDADNVIYAAGTVEIATGEENKTMTIKLSGEDEEYHTDAMSVPNVVSAHIMLCGGSVVNGYSGGDMANITDKTKITVDFPGDAMEARAGFTTTDELDRVWSVLDFSYDEQRSEVSKLNDKGEPIFDFQIFRLFGGNNNADMAIQPDWALNRGYVGSLYSGGNFGKMTYFDEVNDKGLTLTIKSPDMHIDYVYGGGRVGDIEPNVPSGYSNPDFYGATLNVQKGIIDHVYGGNDVAGYIHYGTNVNITGAISGDVYCAGNGNYFYKYDRRGDLIDYSHPKIVEAYESTDPNFPGTRFFILPAKAEYGFKGTKYNPTSLTGYNASDALTVMAINSYRPHVERAKLTIAGTADNEVWVRGKVYCGGNSASIVPKYDSTGTYSYDVKLDIGSYVTLNGVYMGSNGELLALGETIQRTEVLNAVDGNALSVIEDNDLTDSSPLPDGDKDVVDNPLYPTILDLYMRAVEVVDKPENFNFTSGLTRAFIGDFCVGGNRGSMMTDKRIDLDFPPELTIFGKIIGGCMDANVTYKGVTHVGGLTKPLAGTETTKINIGIKSKFRPLNLLYPDVEATPPISIHNFVVGYDGKPWTSGDKYYANQQCNVFGGCYNSGTTVGGIKLDIYSDMLNYDGLAEIDADPTDPTKGKVDNPEYIDKQAVINGIKDARSWRSFTVVGGGYGTKTAVIGNIDVRMLPGKVNGAVVHPSAASIFGGSQEGLIVGNTNVEIRDGKILANVYGASEAAKMYGSTSVIVGYPKYYKVKKAGNYRLNRVDYMSKVSREDQKDEFDEVVVPKTISYYPGEIVPQNVYEMINGRVKNARIKSVIDKDYFRAGKNVDDKYVDKITFDSTATVDDPDSDLSTDSEDLPCKTFYIGDLFEPVTSTKLDASNAPIADHIVPEDFDVTWDNINIWIGDQSSNTDPDAMYYGQGNIYGGGYVPNTTDRTLIGQPTVMRFTKDYNPGRVSEFSTESDAMQDKAIALYGGNTAVMIWDDERTVEVKADGSFKYSEDEIHDHIHIGSGYFKEVTLTAGSSAKGYFERVEKTVPNGSGGTKIEPAYVYLTSGMVDAGKKYYEKEADGGVYGGGRKVFAQAFCSVDIAYYGYAEHTPQQPKLLNTIQRADVASITDCCMELVGASDFTVNDYKGIFYAINRVGELRMNTSLNPNYPLDKGYTDAVISDGIRIHANKRSRNYIALYNKTNHLGAFRSNWTFEDKYHLEDGTVTTKSDTDTDHGYPKDGVESYVNHKHRFIEFYNDYAALRKKAEMAQEDKLPAPFTKEQVDTVIDTYKAFTGKSYDYTPQNPDPSAKLDLYDYLESIGQKMRDEFAKRNVGTSGNMIGISSGYELSFEGLACQRGENYETRYYGPAYGVTEIKLLTTVSDMGGGYVYALNHHRDPAVDDYSDGKLTPGWCSRFGDQDFLQTTGNFVFPGAAYHTNDKGDLHNFIIDDCFDYYNVNHGYYQCDHIHERDIIKSRDDSDPNVNDPHEIHYWYVSGNKYVFNVTLTAITSDSEKTFYLGADNDRVNLFNVEKDTKIIVSEVKWFKHNDLAEGACDITNMDKKYKLYLTLSNDPKNQLVEDSDDKNGAYVIRVPRFTYEASDDSENPGKIINRHTNIDDNYYVDADGNKIIDPNYYLNATVNNNRFGYDKAGNEVTDIVPRLGLRLVDAEHNRYADMGKEWSTKYYEDHLKPDHMLQVVLETKNLNKDGTYSQSIYFVINIDIKYLMGPAVYGNINIENCALPGEYIYVNANDVEVVMDENLGVAEQKWRLYPNKPDGTRYDNPDYKSDYTATKYPTLDPEIATSTELFYKLNTSEFIDAESEKLIHIPAYYYQNGWEPVFAITANGENFERSLPFYEKKSVPDPEDETKNILVDDLTKPIPENRLQIHNYHRMKPLYNGDVLDLRLVEGARIYLESEDDMNYFFKYLDLMQYSDDDLKKPAKNTLYTRFTLPDGRVVNPQFCKKLDFFQQSHLHVPTTTEFSQNNKELDFRGNYHGNGHWMIIPAKASINIANGVGGNMYNTGFRSYVDDDGTRIYDRNDGTITNCFYFNEYEKGCLTETGMLQNCYQNTDVKGGPFAYNQLMKLSTLGFRYGQAAYNLNGFYLQKRHLLLHEEGARAANNAFDLQDKDKELRALQPVETGAGIVDPYRKYAVDYIERMFNNGDYRYALYDDQLSHMGSQFTEALRTAEEPNYFDGLNQRTNKLPVSMHNYAHTKDANRWCDNHKVYHPIFDIDYLFFGENLQVDADDENNKHLPELFTPETRVYRVGGFYGSASDKGFFLNKDAYVDSPLLTALDFVGYRDSQLYSAPGVLKDEVSASLTDTGWWIMNADKDPNHPELYQEVFMPPTIDAPWTENAVDGRHIEFNSFDINSDKVSHNLLIYTHDNDHAKGVMAKYHYSDISSNLDKTLHSYAEHDESTVLAHHILDNTSGKPMVYGGMMHLVDAHDFNAPVAFDVNEAWYTRLPHEYADEYTITSGSGSTYAYKTAWEGICLPYDVRKTYAASTNSIYMSDMGEITHFFGDERKGHEYWLRRYVGVNADKDHLMFERPTALNAVAAKDLVADYAYTNSAFYNLYVDFGYNADHDMLYHNGDDISDPLSLYRTIEGYRHLSHNVPYVVAYPGERYYEFDLSGEFYCIKNSKVTSAVPQSITYFANGEPNSTSIFTIPVTDETVMVEYDKDGYVMHGTFKHVTNDDELSNSVLYDKVTNLLVLDACSLDSKGSIQPENHLGELFVHKSDTKTADKVVVLPFRVYMTTSPNSSPAPMRIGSRDGITPDDVFEDIDPEHPANDSDEAPGVEVWTEGRTLVINTPYDLETYIYNMSGQVVRHIRAYEGINRYSGLPIGFYVVLRTKCVIY